MKNFQNSKKDSFINSFPQASLDSETDTLSNRMKFNFSYFDSSQSLCEDIKNMQKDDSNKIFKKLIEYSRENLEHWENMKIGSGKHRNSIYVNYGAFPKHSKLKHPSYIPHQVLWGRFRLEYDKRLIGFVVPDEYNGKIHCKTGKAFDKNTFYVVFVDPEHNFYP